MLPIWRFSDEQFHTSLCDKCDSVNFNVVNYQYVEQPNTPMSPAYGVYISCIICITRVCKSDKYFKLHHHKMCLKLYHQGFKYHKLCKHLMKTLHVLFAKYDV